MKRIAIVGGGISGLAAAYALEERRLAGESLQYVVFEAAPRLGGVLITQEVDGCLLEAGPDSFLTEKPWAADLCRRVGLEDQLIGSNDGERKTYIVVKGRLTPIPDGLMFMVPTSLMPTFLSPLFLPPPSYAWRASGATRREIPTVTKAWLRWLSGITAQRWLIVWLTRCSPASTAVKLHN